MICRFVLVLSFGMPLDRTAVMETRHVAFCVGVTMVPWGHGCPEGEVPQNTAIWPSW